LYRKGKQLKKTTTFLVCLIAFGLSTIAYSDELEDANAEVVRIFMEEVLGKGQVERITEVMSDDYVQHAPNIGNGVTGFRAFAENASLAERPFNVTIHSMTAQGDLVWVFLSMRLPNGTRAAMDLFRLENGKLVEHWGVGEIVPAPEDFIDPSTGFF